MENRKITIEDDVQQIPVVDGSLLTCPSAGPPQQPFFHSVRSPTRVTNGTFLPSSSDPRDRCPRLRPCIGGAHSTASIRMTTPPPPPPTPPPPPPHSSPTPPPTTSTPA